jgi:hypothetical protein
MAGAPNRAAATSDWNVILFIRRFLFVGLLKTGKKGGGEIPASSPPGKESQYDAIRLAAWVAGFGECRKTVTELQCKSLPKSGRNTADSRMTTKWSADASSA